MYLFFPVVFSAVAYLYGWDTVDAFFWGVAAWIVWGLTLLTVKVVDATVYVIRTRERHPKPAEVP